MSLKNFYKTHAHCMHLPPPPSLPPEKPLYRAQFHKANHFVNESHTRIVLGHTMLGMCGSNYCPVLFIFCGGISLFTVVIAIKKFAFSCFRVCQMQWRTTYWKTSGRPERSATLCQTETSILQI